VFSLLRWCLGIQVSISREQALEIAKEYCLSQGWSWLELEPVDTSFGLRNYEIRTNADSIGGYIRIAVDCSTGVIVAVSLAPR
jgi:hypothetical protein